MFALANAVDVEIPAQCPEQHAENTMIRLKHESECSKYYECLQGKKILKVCPYRNEYNDRLHFNPALQACAWPDLTICEDANANQPRVCPGDLKRCIGIPDEKYCDRYYLCDHDRQEVRRCAEGLHFNPATQMCDYPKNAGCEISCVWTCCPPKGSKVKVRLPHECSCSQYYECKDGEYVSESCPKGEHFDNRLKRCRPADEAGCIVRPMMPPSEALVKCPENNAGGAVKLSHELDCGKYYECVAGEMILRSCSDGCSFNPLLGACDFPKHIPCNVSRCCSPRAFVVQPATPKPSDENNRRIVDVLPLEKDPDCPAEGTVKIPYPTNCTNYYLCENGWKTIHECLWGLYFNPIISECDWPHNEIVCNPHPKDLALLRTGVSVSEDDPDKVVCYGECPFPDPMDRTIHLPANDCTKFCKCSNGVPYPKKCPKGLRFNRKEQVCDWPWAVKCEDDLAENTVANLAGNS
ncbi:PREDICTED: probable chitinase 3 isoform X2 [Dinoponera quadriceps]|nr:PREDICTED: probable chitinase 3 isoform X2 [Dinoponera quadriceps]XP_014470061.1 PREDICTED: probable chitinase 3 isoform X2 [Dinoponera quadriceps]XP_014470063.1 PREDICTED: probable chitinase 3 isoform X2 [Dinoponera quadriceps]